MLSDDEQLPENSAAAPRVSVPKWPFFVVDAILVLAALAVWSSSGGLSTSQLFFCLGSVGLGAIIFAVPYALENFSPASWNIMADDSTGSDSDHSTTEDGNKWERQARAAAEAVEHAVRANAALESSARRFDARFAPLVEVQQNLVAVAAELREAAAGRETAANGGAMAVQREFERLRKEQAEKFKTTEEKIAALGDTLAVLAGHLKTLSARPGPTAQAPVQARAQAPAPVRVEEVSVVDREAPVFSGAGVEVMEAPAEHVATKPAVAVEQPAPNVPAELVSVVEAAPYGSVSFAAGQVEQLPDMGTAPVEEKSMLAKALARAQSSGQTPAVAGIIMARARRPKKSKPPIPVVESVAANAADLVAPATTEVAAVPAVPVEPEGWSSLAEGKLDTVIAEEAPSADLSSVRTEIEPSSVKIEELTSGDTGSAFRRSARAKIIALRGDEEEAARKDTPVVFTPSRVDISTDQPSEGPTQGELLAREAETIRKKRSSRSPVSACVLTAQVLIGIGNKPFVRGTGPGLSLEKGVPMEFVEIGQWRWVAPGAVKEAITLRILKNDEVPAEGDSILLHPGQSLEVSPVFPA